MGFFARLFGKKESKPEFHESVVVEAGACPNCWGKQEYADEYRDYQKDQTKSNINNDRAHQKAFVQQFVETHVTGIRLKREGESLVCPKCNSEYNHESTK